MMNGQRLLISTPEGKGGQDGGSSSQNHTPGPEFIHSLPPCQRKYGPEEVGTLGFKCQFCPLPTVWPWARHLTSLNFRFLLCTMWIVAAPAQSGCGVEPGVHSTLHVPGAHNEGFTSMGCH